MHKLKINGRLPRTCARRQRPAIVGTGSVSVKVIAALQHTQTHRTPPIALLFPWAIASVALAILSFYMPETATSPAQREIQ
jgi:hypothetical protein